VSFCLAYGHFQPRSRECSPILHTRRRFQRPFSENVIFLLQILVDLDELFPMTCQPTWWDLPGARGDDQLIFQNHWNSGPTGVKPGTARQSIQVSNERSRWALSINTRTGEIGLLVRPGHSIIAQALAGTLAKPKAAAEHPIH